MKTIRRFLLGILSSALLAAGLSRAADRLDPINRYAPACDAIQTQSSPDTSTSCWVDDSTR